MKISGRTNLTDTEFPVVVGDWRRWFQEIHKVGVGRLEVVDDGARIWRRSGEICTTLMEHPWNTSWNTYVTKIQAHMDDIGPCN